MTRNILVGFNDTPRSERALRFACSTFPDDAITVLFAIDSHTDPTAMSGWGNTSDQFERWVNSRTADAEALFERAEEIAGEYGATVETEVALGRVHRAIVDYGEQHHPDFVVVGLHGRSRIESLLVGDVFERLVRTSELPTVSVRDSWTPRPREGTRRVLVPFNDAPEAAHALEYACRTFDDMDVVAMYVDTHERRVVARQRVDGEMTPSAWVDEHREYAEDVLDRASEIADEYDVAVETLNGFGPVDEVVNDYAMTERLDLVVFGVRDPGALRTYVSEPLIGRLIHRSDAPVLGVRLPEGGGRT